MGTGSQVDGRVWVTDNEFRRYGFGREVTFVGNSQPPPIEQVEEILDDIDEAIRELRPDGDTPASDEATADDDESS